ncbi:MAG TPA: glycosyltransferase family 2 protein [Gemmatimonadota bacterium]|nr:glycosyltransferase family 2 protein [Gemmatimonadota bacterium]
MNRSVSLFVPAYDEAGTLFDTMPRLLRAAEEVAPHVQLIIVDNGSTDTTVAVARDLAAIDPRIVPLRIPERGVGAALRAALPHLRHDAVVAVDADLAMDLSFVGDALDRLTSGADVVVGAKRTDAQNRPRLRVLVSDLFVFVMRRGLGVPFHDVSIGAKAYRKELLERYEGLIGRGSNYVIDILVQAWRDGLRIEEIGVACEDNRKSHFNLLHEGVYRFGHLFALVLRRRLGLLRPSTRPAASSPSPEALPVSR